MFIVNMQVETSIRNKVFSKFTKYPLIEKYFRPILSDFENDTLLLENDLVFAVLKDYDDQLAFRENAIAKIEERYQELLPEIFKEYRVDKRAFNKRINDLWSELGSVLWLMESGYCKIKKVKREKGQKTPDYTAQKGNETEIFELKNLRVPVDSSYWIGAKLGVRELIDEEKYQHFFEITVTPHNLSAEQFVQDDINEVEVFLKCIDKSLSARKLSASHLYKKVVRGVEITRTFDCKIHYNKSFDVMIYSGTPIRMARLYNKTSKDIRTAVNQLNANDVEKVKKRWVLLNLQNPAEWDFFNGNHSVQFGRFLNKVNFRLNSKIPGIWIRLI